MKNAKGKGASRTEKKEVSLPVEDRKIGKRKAALKASESRKKRVMKEKIIKKDPNKPKRPPSSFFVFLYVSLNLIWFANYNIILKITSWLCNVTSRREEFRTIYKQEHPNMKAVSAVGKAGGEKWKSMSASEKAPYEAKAAKRKSDYGKLMTDYNKKQETDDGGGDQEDESGQSHGSKSKVNDQDDSDESVGEDEDSDDDD